MCVTVLAEDDVEKVNDDVRVEQIEGEGRQRPELTTAECGTVELFFYSVGGLDQDTP